VDAAAGAQRPASEAQAEIARALAASGRTAEALPWMEAAAKSTPERYHAELEALRRGAGERP
jgi:3-oxoacyl-(acyl-carrier-protein) synthase